jgi:hypothetical protein
MTRDEHIEALERKIKYLSHTTWERRINLVDVREWLVQFDENAQLEYDEQLHVLFLLSNFIYFGQPEIRELLRAIYRDLFRARLIYEIRRTNGGTRDATFIRTKYEEIKAPTRFLGIGNPSESGTHLLYYFRQENRLGKQLFINSHEVFRRATVAGRSIQVIRDSSITHYVYIDDLCGSGTQAAEYSRDIVVPLKDENAKAKIFYFVLFATSEGLKAVRDLRCFDAVEAIFELDETFKTLEPESRVFEDEAAPFLRERVRATCVKYGRQIFPAHPLGYKDGQLMLGFSHNTPDNTLPIFWCDASVGAAWTPIFRRYNKDYGW